MDILAWLRDWYESNCDGYWEHMYGVKIETLDNPGWAVDIDLEDTYLEEVEFNEVHIYIDDSDWMICKVEDGVFKGDGDIYKLEKILRIFYKWAEANKN